MSANGTPQIRIAETYKAMIKAFREKFDFISSIGNDEACKILGCQNCPFQAWVIIKKGCNVGPSEGFLDMDLGVTHRRLIRNF